MKDNLSVLKWLDIAVSGIRFGPDRAKVREELLEHLEDKAADLQRIFPDMDAPEAQNRALAGMGDPEELKRELARVHRPWLGWLWRASRWLLWGTWLLFLLFQAGVPTDFDNSFRGRTGTEVYHRIRDGEKAQLGQYIFQITGAAYVDRPEGTRDSLQVILRASSPKFWERIDPEAVFRSLTAAAPDGTRYPMDRAEIVRYTVEDGQGGSITYQNYLAGAKLCDWEPWHREFAVFVPAEGWEPGDRVTLELDSPAGRIELSAPVTERVVIP